MEKLNIVEVKSYVNKNISIFHQSKLSTLKSIDLKALLKKKNPYLFRAKNITVAGDLVKGILDAFLFFRRKSLVISSRI